MSSIPYLDLRPHEPTLFHIRPLRPTIPPNDDQEVPHRHNFQEIMWVQAGNGRHTIDHRLLEISPNTFYLIAKGQVHQFIEGYELVGYLLRFTDDFLLALTAQTTWNYQVTLFNSLSINQTLPVRVVESREYEMLFSLMMAEQQNGVAYGKSDLLRHLLLALLLKLERVRQRLAEASAASERGEGQTAVLQAFLQLLEEKHRETHYVSDYAAELSVTPRQLSRILKEALGKTAKQLIEERLMVEAKRYLMHTNYSVKETSYLLGYKDPSYFSKVFKRATGVVPQAYRV